MPTGRRVDSLAKLLSPALVPPIRLLICWDRQERKRVYTQSESKRERKKEMMMKWTKQKKGKSENGKTVV